MEEKGIPYYIFQEVVEYVEQTALGRCRMSKWSNIEALMGLAICNNRMTKEQANRIRADFCREK